MTPRDIQPSGQYDFFKKRTDEVAHKNHPLVILSDKFNWEVFNKSFGSEFDPKNGRPGLSTRLMVGLHYIKHAYNLSDERVLAGFLESPQWQYFCGLEYYTDKLPCDRSSLTRWRQRAGADKLELLLKETIEVAKRGKLLKRGELKTAVVDTTVQEKAIAFPTDSRLCFKALSSLVRLCDNSGIKLRQTYKRLSKRSLTNQLRFAHLRRFKKARREQRRLKVYLGRVIRDIKRKVPNWQEDIRLSRLLEISHRILQQKKSDKDKVYSVHAPEVKCYSKGKAHKRYEFGSKVSVAVSAKQCWVLGIKSWTESIHDVLTLKSALSQVQDMTGVLLERVLVDKGYRGAKHHPEGVDVRVSGQSPSQSVYFRRLSRRRSIVEATIGHLKSDGRMGRNFLLGEQGDAINALLSGTGHNIRKLMKEAYRLPSFFVSFLRGVFLGGFSLQRLCDEGSSTQSMVVFCPEQA